MQVKEGNLLVSESGGHRLTFDEKLHRYSLDGKRVKSTTGTIKAGYPEGKALTGWKIGQGAEYAISNFKKLLAKTKKTPSQEEIRKLIKDSKSAFLVKSRKAANIGSIVHDYAYCYEKRLPFDMDKILKHKDKKKIENAVGQFINWKTKNTDEIIELEHIVASPRYWFAGKFDRLVRREGKIILSDYKTSTGIYPDMFIQGGSYSIAIEEWLGLTVDIIEIVRFGKDGSFEVKAYEDKTDILNFKYQALHCLATTTFRKKYEGGY